MIPTCSTAAPDRSSPPDEEIELAVSDGSPDAFVDEMLPRRPVAVRHARALASDALGLGSPVHDDGLALVITELVANAVRHGRGRRMRLRLHVGEGTVRVEVVNRCWTTRPRRRLASYDRQSGRGLRLVAAYSRCWGVVQESRGRTRVWAEVERR